MGVAVDDEAVDEAGAARLAQEVQDRFNEAMDGGNDLQYRMDENGVVQTSDRNSGTWRNAPWNVHTRQCWNRSDCK